MQPVNILVIHKIGRLRSGSLICQSQVLLPTELSCYQLITTITFSHNGKSSFEKEFLIVIFKYHS